MTSHHRHRSPSRSARRPAAEPLERRTLMASVGDFVWSDLNANGIQDAGEPGLAGVALQLYRSNNSLVSTTTTDADGRYRFDDAPAGVSLYLRITPPFAYAVTEADRGSDDAVDSDFGSTG